MTQEGSSNAVCTRDEIVKFIGTVAYELAASGVAKSALLAAAKATGWDDVESSISAMHAAATAPPPPPPGSAKKSGKGKKALENGQAEDGKETKERKPRKMTALNIFTTYVMDMIHKDSSNPAFKMETTKVDAEGNTVPVRGPHMTFVSNCWKTLGESDKQEFTNIITPCLDKINDIIVSGGTKPEIMPELLSHLQGSHQEDKLRKLVHQSVIASTGMDPSKSHGNAPAATPAKESADDKKRKSKDKAPSSFEKPAKKSKTEETKDDKAEKKAAKKAKEEAERKAKEEAERKRKQEEEEAARKKAEEEEESSEEEGSSEEEDDDESGSGSDSSGEDDDSSGESSD